MRPKKVILTIGSNPTRERILGYLLWSRAYEVIAIHPESDALLDFPRGIDLIVCNQDLDGMHGNDLIRSLKTTAPDTPMILVSYVLKEWPANCAADAFIGKSADQSQLLHTIRLLAARKRGPKPVRHPALEEAVGCA